MTQKVFTFVNFSIASMLEARNAQFSFAEKTQMRINSLN